MTQFSIVSSKGILLKRLSTSKLAMIQLQSVLVISLANANKSLSVYLLVLSGDKVGTAKLANFYDGVFIVSMVSNNSL